MSHQEASLERDMSCKFRTLPVAAKDRTEASFLLHDIFLQQKEGLVSGAHTAARDHAWKRFKLEVAWLPAQTIPLDLSEGPEGSVGPT